MAIRICKSHGVAAGWALRYASITGCGFVPRRAATRCFSPASSRASFSGVGLSYHVSSVRAYPMSSGMAAERAGAAGSPGEEDRYTCYGRDPRARSHQRSGRVLCPRVLDLVHQKVEELDRALPPTVGPLVGHGFTFSRGMAGNRSR